MTPSDKLGSLPYLGAIFDHGFAAALAWGILASFGAMNILAVVLEHRVLIPNQQYASFYKGDLLGLPVMIGSIASMAVGIAAGVYWFQGTWWHVTWLSIGLAVGVGFMLMEYSAHAYTIHQMLSPTKLYHNLVVFPLMVYWVCANGIPTLIYSENGPRGIFHGNYTGLVPVVVFGASLAYWIKLILHDLKVSDDPSKQAHVGVTAPQVFASLALLVAIAALVTVMPKNTHSALVLSLVFMTALGFYLATYAHDGTLPKGAKPWAHVEVDWGEILPWGHQNYPFWTNNAPTPSWAVAH